MTIPSPPSDLSGGYMIGTYSNGTDTHKFRLHVRAFDPDGTYTTPGAGTPTTVMADFTGYAGKLKAFLDPLWQISLTAIFQNNGDGTFTEIFGWTVPAVVAGTSGTATPNDQTRALQYFLNFRDGHGGRGRISVIGSALLPATHVPQSVGGSPTGDLVQQIVDYLTNPVKTNIVSHAGHQFQSPGRETFVVNKRLRRHYGYA